jgi:hypothetical protein
MTTNYHMTKATAHLHVWFLDMVIFIVAHSRWKVQKGRSCEEMTKEKKRTEKKNVECYFTNLFCETSVLLWIYGFEVLFAQHYWKPMLFPEFSRYPLGVEPPEARRTDDKTYVIDICVDGADSSAMWAPSSNWAHVILNQMLWNFLTCFMIFLKGRILVLSHIQVEMHSPYTTSKVYVPIWLLEDQEFFIQSVTLPRAYICITP